MPITLQLFKCKSSKITDQTQQLHHCTSKSQRCEHLPTPLICTYKFCLTAIRHWMLLTFHTDKLLLLPLQVWNSFGFPSSFGPSAVFFCLWRFFCLLLCVRLIVASLHCWCCSARKTHPLWLSPPPIGCCLEAVTSPFFSSRSVPPFSDHFFIVSILFSALHSLGAKWKTSIISSVIGRICLKGRGGDSIKQRSDDMLNAVLFCCTIKGFLPVIWWVQVMRIRNICYVNEHIVMQHL